MSNIHSESLKLIDQYSNLGLVLDSAAVAEIIKRVSAQDRVDDASYSIGDGDFGLVG